MRNYSMEILSGSLGLPGREAILETFGVYVTHKFDKVWSALWFNYLRNRGAISLPYWLEQVARPKEFNQILKALSDANWIICETVPEKNWSEAHINEAKLLEFASLKELEQVRSYYKYQKYMLTNEEPVHNNLTRINGKVKNTGLVRNGFFKSGSTKFQFDTKALNKHYDVVVEEATKAMTKIIDEYPELQHDTASYRNIIVDVVDSINSFDIEYCSGQYYADSRGRNIAGMLKKIFNPISFKVARALLVIPERFRVTATEKGMNNIYLFIAEIHGFKKGTIQDKINSGRDKYYRQALLDLDYSIEDDRKNAYENIWLERLYDELDEYHQLTKVHNIYRNRYTNGTMTLEAVQAILEANSAKEYKWSVPIEIDMSASVLGYVGILTNHKPFMERCNMLGTELTDAWEIKGIPNRNQAKVIMRTIYGSSQACQDMWKNLNIPYVPQDIVSYNNALQNGEIAVGDRFSKFIITNCNPQPEMKLRIRNEEFTIECNRFRSIGEKPIAYDLYDSETSTYRRIHHYKTYQVPDLDQFRRFMVTGIIHNLDSQVENTTSEAVYDLHQWVIDIHDALILNPESADYARAVYVKELEDIHTNRNEILTEYFQSINIPGAAIQQWKAVKDSVEPLTEEFHCNHMVLK